MIESGSSLNCSTTNTFVRMSSATRIATAPKMRSRRPRGGASTGLSPPLATGLALHALLRPRDHFEAGDRNAIAARDAESEAVVVHLRQRALDVFDRLAG